MTDIPHGGDKSATGIPQPGGRRDLVSGELVASAGFTLPLTAAQYQAAAESVVGSPRLLRAFYAQPTVLTRRAFVSEVANEQRWRAWAARVATVVVDEIERREAARESWARAEVTELAAKLEPVRTEVAETVHQRSIAEEVEQRREEHAARIRRNVTLDVGAVRRARAGLLPASPPTRRGGRMGADGRPWLWIHDDLRKDVSLRVGSLLDLMAGQDRIASLEVRPATPDDGMPSAAAAEFRANTDGQTAWAEILVQPGLRGPGRRALAVDHEAVHLAHMIEELETAGDDWRKAWTKYNSRAGETLAERLAHHVERQADMRHWSAGGYRQLVRDGLADLAEIDAKAERLAARAAAAKHAKPKWSPP